MSDHELGIMPSRVRALRTTYQAHVFTTAKCSCGEWEESMATDYVGVTHVEDCKVRHARLLKREFQDHMQHVAAKMFAKAMNVPESILVMHKEYRT